jgi:transposase
MRKKHSYRSEDVEQFDLSKMLPLLATGCIVAFDVAKAKFYLAVATLAGEVVGLLRFEHPRQSLALLEIVRQLRAASGRVQTVFEPTGTYGDWLQEHCERAGCEVWMVPPKFTHDAAEIMDGVPSMHDPKAAKTLVQLHVLGKSKRWERPSERRRELRALVDESNMYWSQLMPLYGRLEAMLAKYWPELEQWVDVYEQKSWMALMVEMPGPELVKERAEEAKALLRRTSRNALKWEKINGLVDSASKTLGVPMNAAEQGLLRKLVEQIRKLRTCLDDVDEQLSHAARSIPEAKAMGEVVGMPTAAVLYTMVGAPSRFGSAAAYEKAFGLNLKVRSSGKYEGHLKITKRGSALARHRMYMAALRQIASNDTARAWYQNRDGFKANQKCKAVVALMRKLVRALWHVAQGSPFMVTKLFDVRRLHITPKTSKKSTNTTDEKARLQPSKKPNKTQSVAARQQDAVRKTKSNRAA